MNNALTVSFQLKKSKAAETGPAPLYARITIGGQRAEFSLRRTVDPQRWMPRAGAAKGTGAESRSLNSFLQTVRFKLYEHYRSLLDSGKPLTAEALKNAYHGISEKSRTLCEAFQSHNDKMQTLIGRRYAEGTHHRYTTALNHTREFIRWKYGVDDLELKQIDYEFVSEFAFYLETHHRCSHNTTMKYLSNLKKVVRENRRHLKEDPFAGFSTAVDELDVGYLTEEELQVITEKNLSIPRLAAVRDVFLFCCYTGLCYADVHKLSRDHIIIGIDGKQWINIHRTKTETTASIPLLPQAESLLAKYAHHPFCAASGRLLPVLSNQKMNAYLKEIGDLCGIKKELHTHLARHTFATLALNNKMPLESVSRMLGHKSVRQTEHYAKVGNRKLSEDMADLRRELQRKQNQRRGGEKIQISKKSLI